MDQSSTSGVSNPRLCPNDSIFIFNKFEALNTPDAALETRSTFDYEENRILEVTSKSDGEIQSTWKERRRKQIPPSTIQTRSSARIGTSTAQLS